MQAVISRSGRVGKNPFAMLALVAGLMLGGIGGYWINGVLRPSSMTAGTAHTRMTLPGNDLALSATRHAATERAEALEGIDIAASMARHANSERVEAGAISGLSP